MVATISILVDGGVLTMFLFWPLIGIQCSLANGILRLLILDWSDFLFCISRVQSFYLNPAPDGSQWIVLQLI